MKPVFLLRGFLICPFCERRLTGSISTGRCSKYRYYHCSVSRCKGRIRADILESEYEYRLRKITIRPEVNELFEIVLEDENILTVERECINERKKVLREISGQEILMPKLRRYFLDDKIDLQDFNDLKKEYKEMLDFLNEQLALVNERLISSRAFKNIVGLTRQGSNVLALYKNQDVAGKRYIIELFTPTSFNQVTRGLNPLQVNQALSMITSHSGHSVVIDYTERQTLQQIPTRVFSDRNVSIAQSIKILRKNGIEANERQTKEILDFLYLLAKMHGNQDDKDALVDNIPEGDIEHQSVI